MFKTGHTLSRRRFLASSAVTAGTLAFGTSAYAEKKKDPYGGFKMGVQSYSLRGFKDPNVALKHTATLGLKYWEAYPGHLPMGATPKHISDQKAILKDAGVKLLAYGVVNFDANETKSRAVFDFAKAMGIVSLSANPKKDKATFDLLDKLCAEYKIAIAIHNHGPGALYDKVTDVHEMVNDRHPLVLSLIHI